MILENGFNTNDDFKGPISDLIKITNSCNQAGLEVKNMINVLKRPNKKEVLKEINEFKGRTEVQKAMEELKAKNERIIDFGIGEY